MSLLMEALKKAEAEKKKAALEQQSLKVSRTGEHAAVPGTGVTPGEAPVPPFTGTFDTSKLSLEPIERTPTAEPLPPSAPPGEEEADRYAMTPQEHEEFPPGRAREIDLAAEEPYEYGEPISLTEPSPTPPAHLEEASALVEPPSAPSTTSETTVTETKPEGVRTGRMELSSPGRTALRDTPMAAQAVLALPSRRRSPVATLALAVVAGMVIFVAVMGFLYWKTVPPVRPLPASAIAGAAHGPAALPEVQPQPSLDQAVAPPAEQPSPAAAESTSAAPEAAATPPAPAAEGATPAPAEKAEVAAAPAAPLAPPPEQPAVAAVETGGKQVTEKPAVAVEQEKQPSRKALKGKTPKSKPAIAASDQNQVSASTYDVSPGEIKISTVPATKTINPKIQQAYDAYQSADYQRAEQLYREVLDKQPDQRDALLGLAAIALRRGDRAGAGEFYGRLLRLNPNDAYAQATWTALRREQPTVADESDLKLLLQQDPKAAHVHYLLGNVYAHQGRWPEAQQAYFEAYKQDPHNTDYVYNLAVSLDHMGERKTALNYYREALDLADKQPVNFATDQVLGRIQALSDAGVGGPP